eukprot:gnl/TRDRNA2_/TRDRNA2_136602_c0_seq1.p1 gnl/TRDRNA2_/TRDRNA2_136602_c0~~gnl/TRDRNA2_/TRDRNA2_136602_c0_seq1.p1  ORF type:complete len:295 (-),score=91.62 gnl/TRDRNA2_/TRDRNA2_136602_c0_seq1:86-970(-)
MTLWTKVIVVAVLVVAADARHIRGRFEWSTKSAVKPFGDGELPSFDNEVASAFESVQKRITAAHKREVAKLQESLQDMAPAKVSAEESEEDVKEMPDEELARLFRKDLKEMKWMADEKAKDLREMKRLAAEKAKSLAAEKAKMLAAENAKTLAAEAAAASDQAKQAAREELELKRMHTKKTHTKKKAEEGAQDLMHRMAKIFEKKKARHETACWDWALLGSCADRAEFMQRKCPQTCARLQGKKAQVVSSSPTGQEQLPQQITQHEEAAKEESQEPPEEHPEFQIREDLWDALK